MKKLAVLLILFGGYHISIGQNLIPNPGFECGIDTCGQILEGSHFGLFCCNWWGPTSGCPDLFSTKLGSGCFNAQPNKLQNVEQPGSIMPHSGSRFAGIFTYGSTVGAPYEYREYLTCPLIQPLTVGAYYIATMWVASSPDMAYQTNNLGMYFHEQSWVDNGLNNIALPEYQPQVYSNGIITSTQWIKLCWIFIADVPAKYVVIGNFSTDENTQAITTSHYVEGGLDSYYACSYYFIDDVRVEQIPNYGQPSILTVDGNKTICLNQLSKLYTDQPFDEVKWFLASDTATVLSFDTLLQVSPSQTTTYLAEGSYCKEYPAKDTVTVRVNPVPTISLGKDTTMCQGNVLVLSPGSGYAQYQWQDNSSSNTYNVDGPGEYGVVVKNQYGCSDTSSIAVRYFAPPKVNLNKEYFYCSSFEQLSVVNKNSKYLWSTGSTDSVFVPDKGGIYWVTVKNYCGEVSDTTQVHSLNEIFVPNVVILDGNKENQTLKFLGIGDTEGCLTILNRWGEILSSEYPYKNDWPLDKNTPSGVYYFNLSFPGCEERYKGWIEVIK